MQSSQTPSNYELTTSNRTLFNLGGFCAIPHCDDISKLPYLIRLSRATLKTIQFSILLSLLINFIAIILSFFGLLGPVTGALVHNAGSVFVILIAALLYDRKFKNKYFMI